jgi:spermidine synthase
MNNLLRESIAPDWGQYFEKYTLVFEEKSDDQHLILIDTESYGRVLILDGYVQVTEKDNFIYHEMLTHVPVLSHGNCKQVLIIGGGDGGMAKEVLKYPEIEVTMVEIDRAVIDFSKKYLPGICGNAFESDRLDLKIADGALFVQQTDQKFDVIIVDSTDPHGPGEVLFTREFYANCKKILSEGGILVTQNGIPFTQEDELRKSVTYFRELFNTGTCYLADIPSYIGGPMAFGFATDAVGLNNLDKNLLEDRFDSTNIKTLYYNPAVHAASFALPNYIKEIIA